jgi:type II secretory pathway pseudopilin PulG
MEELIAQIITTAIIAAIIFVPLGYAIAKRKLKELIKCLEAVDRAIEDDKITKEEVKEIWEKCSVLWKKEMR